MLRLIGVMISIGLADSINPSTIGPALYIATGERGRARVTQFTVGVFGAYFLGGLAIVIGARQLIRPLLPHPSHDVTGIIEVAIGAGLIIAAALLWGWRHRLAHRDLPDFDPHGRSSLVLGASIVAVELPTAFPYFAAIAAILGGGLGPARNMILLALFNLCFVAPLLCIIATLTFAPDRSERALAVGRGFLQRHWPSVLAGVALLAGMFVVALGVSGIGGTHSRFLRRLHHTLRG